MAKKIIRLEISGVIEEKNETYNQKWLLETLENLEEDKKICALILYINSPGGGVYQSAEVFEAVRRFSEKSKKPVWAYFAALAASGGYYIGCGADRIAANANTLTGSIGVIAGRFLDLTGFMARHGIKEELIHAGRNKIMGHFSEPATEEQRSIMQSIADECYDDFLKLVATRRNLDESRVRELADGRIYTAKQALSAGLVDEIMTFDALVEKIKEETGEKKAQIKKLAPKKKKTLRALLKEKSAVGAIEESLKALRAPCPFPAFYWDGGRTF